MRSSRPTARSTAPSCCAKSSAALPPRRPAPGTGASRRLAGLGVALPAAAVRPPRAHAQIPPRRDPRRDPARPLQRPPRGPEQQDPPDQPPQLRLPLRRRADRPRLPLLHRHHHRATAMNFTHNSTGAPEFGCHGELDPRLMPVRATRYVREGAFSDVAEHSSFIRREVTTPNIQNKVVVISGSSRRRLGGGARAQSGHGRRRTEATRRGRVRIPTSRAGRSRPGRCPWTSCASLSW